MWEFRLCSSGQFMAIFCPKRGFFCSDFNFLLSDSPENVAFWKNLVFGHFVIFSGGKLGPKMDQNCKGWVRSVAVKMHIFERLFKCFFVLEKCLWWKFQLNATTFGEENAKKKHPKRAIAESIQKIFKTLNLTTTNSILMKLTRNIF